MKLISDETILSIHLNPDRQDWEYICSHYILPESFMKKFQHKINWIDVSEYQLLTESFIREFKDKLNWNYMSQHQLLTESFIREFKYRLCWRKVAQYQNLSKSLIQDYDVNNWFPEYIFNIHTIPSVIYKTNHPWTNRFLYKDKYKEVVKRYYTQRITKRSFKEILPKECIKIITSYL